MPTIPPRPGSHAKPTRALETLYIQQAASKWGVSTETLWGVYGVESDFGDNATNSSAGACCYMQFMPATAAQYGVTRGNFRSEVFGAAHYLHDLKANKDPESTATTAALNAYNGNGGGTSVTEYVKGVRDKGGSFGHTGPANEVAGAVGDAVDAVTAPIEVLADFVGLLGQSSTWLRTGKVLFGAALLGMGALALILQGGKEVSKTPVGRVATRAIPAGRAVKAATGGS